MMRQIGTLIEAFDDRQMGPSLEQRNLLIAIALEFDAMAGGSDAVAEGIAERWEEGGGSGEDYLSALALLNGRAHSLGIQESLTPPPELE
jgi:hypothetical protein